MIARAVVSETRQVICGVCGEGPVSGGPGYLVQTSRGYQHGDVRACLYVVEQRIQARRRFPAWRRLWLVVRDVVGR